jgi:hypothetical protein
MAHRWLRKGQPVRGPPDAFLLEKRFEGDEEIQVHRG